MGRLAHLERLALGRSAFEDLDAEQLAALADNVDEAQQYNDKGRPINSTTEKLNAELLHAQNDILALVGIVEHKEQVVRREEIVHQRKVQARRKTLEEEDAYGSILGLAAFTAAYFAHNWTDGFLGRMQIGFYAPQQTIVSIVAEEWQAISSASITHRMLAIFPGLGDFLIDGVLKFLLLLGAQEAAGALQKYIISRSGYHKDVSRRLHAAVALAYEGFWVAVEVSMLPMSFYIAAQRLGLAPVTSLFPPTTTFWPRSPASFHHVGWKPLVSVAILRFFTSPAALMLMNRIVRRDASDVNEPHTPGLTALTKYRNPAIDECCTEKAAPHFLKDPFGWIMYRQYCFRRPMLRWTGWSMYKSQSTTSVAEKWESNIMDQTPSETTSLPKQTVHRSTTLAQLPATVLAMNIDEWIFQALLLPLQSLMLRSLASTYMSMSEMPKTSRSIIAADHLYSPFGGGPIWRFVKAPSLHMARSEANSYACRVGLAFALDCSVDLVLFGVVYQTVRNIGIGCFGWGTGQDKSIPETSGVQS